MKKRVIVLIVFLLFLQLVYSEKNPHCGNEKCDWWESIRTCPEDCEELEPIEPPEDEIVKLWDDKGISFVMDVDKKEIAIISIRIDLRKEIEGAQLRLKRAEDSIIDSLVYQTIDIESWNIVQDNIRKITISFEVKGEWLENVDRISVHVLNGTEWKAYKANKLDINSYQTIIPMLSKIRIKGTKEESRKVQVNVSNTIDREEDTEQEVDFDILLILLVSGIILAIAMVFFYRAMFRS
jgi:hypothetical protein